MAINIGARRAAKNQRRKAAVAEMRKAETLAGSTAGRVHLALTHPIQHCLVSGHLFDLGIGMLVLARGATPENVTMAVFLLDTYALGAKDVFLRSLTGGEFDRHIDRMSINGAMVPIVPAHARKLLHDLVAWSDTLGFRPHDDYAKIERIFGATRAEGPAFQFGHEGTPLLIGDLSDMPPRLVRRDSGITIDGLTAANTLDEAPLEHAAPAEARDGAN